MDLEIMNNSRVCNDTILLHTYPRDGQLYCNATFDGYTCWDYTRAGTTAYGTCPEFMSLHFGQASGKPFKVCNTDGTWFRHPETNQPWTDYSGCGNTERVQRALNVLYVYFTGYTLSIIALVAALLIFTSYKPLRCTRVTIHINLFLSYILTGIMWITYYASSSFNPKVLADNPIWCRIFHVFAHYTTVCNYAWMLCEGLYLHTILVSVFSDKKRVLRKCFIIGWGLPVIPCVIYTTLRSTNPTLDTSCWHDYTYLIWILTGPVALLLFINILFLVNILRIVCSKVCAINQIASKPIRQSLRATLTLIPLLGVQFLVLPFRPENGDEKGQFVYDLISAIQASFQGLLVALLFCFFNKEVIVMLRKDSNFLQKLSLSKVSQRPGYLYSIVELEEKKRKGTKSVEYSKKDHNQTESHHNLPDMNITEMREMNI